jgi:hypothetical protein
LIFFGTPHSGSSDAAKVEFGKACVSIAHFFTNRPTNSIMEALKPSSLFSDILKESFRHQLENYLIVSFYEDDRKVSTKISTTLV